MYRSFVSLGRYTPKYFILFVAVVNGIVSLISLSLFSLLVYRNARDIYLLILYPATCSTRFLTVQRVSVPTPALFKGQLYLCITYAHPLVCFKSSLDYSWAGTKS